MAGQLETVKIFCMRSRYSGKSFVRAYPMERHEMFFAAHIWAFAFFGGVFPVIVFDKLNYPQNKSGPTPSPRNPLLSG